MFATDQKPPVALVFQYIKSSVPVCATSISKETVFEILRRLNAIHNALVSHGDLYPRNLLIDERGDPVWVGL